MLHLALATLLTLQDASASPGVGGQIPRPTPRTTPAGRRAKSPTPPRETTPTPTPTPRPSNDMLVVVNKSDNSLSVLDAATGKLKWTAPIGSGPHEVEVLAGGRLVAVSDYGRTGKPGRTVSIVEVATGKVMTRIDTGEGSRPHGLAALKDGRLLVTAEGKKELLLVDPKTAVVVQRIPTGRAVSHMVAASPDGKRAYVTSLGHGSLTIMDLAAGKVLQDVPTGKGAEGVDVTPDGREIWVVNRAADTISVVDASTRKVVSTISAGEFPIRVKITPDGKRALVSFTESGDIGVFDVATRALVKRIPLGRDAVHGRETRVFKTQFGASPAPVGIYIAPDGRRAWVAASHADVVVVLDLQNLRIEDAWTTGREPDGLSGKF